MINYPPLTTLSNRKFGLYCPNGPLNKKGELPRLDDILLTKHLKIKNAPQIGEALNVFTTE